MQHQSCARRINRTRRPARACGRNVSWLNRRWANLLLWRSVYESNGVFHVDGIRVGVPGSTRVYTGKQARRFLPARDLPDLSPTSALHHDIERFRYFSEDYVILDPKRENVLVDLALFNVTNRVVAAMGD